MAFKRHIDRLPIIPTDAKKHNVTCHYCIVGCGYHAYTWPINRQGGTPPERNVFGVDLAEQQAADTDAWYSPSMYNVVKQAGQDVHIVIKPDHQCVVNSGLGSVRGARMAEMSYSEPRNTQQQRLTDPLVWRYGQMQPTSWEDALDLVARVTAAVVKQKGEDELVVSAFDHGGAGGGFENTWGTGKLYFGAMKIKNIRIHNRPAYNSEVHATRDMGVGELNNCYEDAELADTIFCVGANPLEAQTNYFLNHWIQQLARVDQRRRCPKRATPPQNGQRQRDSKGKTDRRAHQPLSSDKAGAVEQQRERATKQDAACNVEPGIGNSPRVDIACDKYGDNCDDEQDEIQRKHHPKQGLVWIVIKKIGSDHQPGESAHTGRNKDQRGGFFFLSTVCRDHDAEGKEDGPSAEQCLSHSSCGE
nr:AoxB [Sinorhizobium sp. GW3]